MSGATAAVVVVEGSLGENSQVCASISGRSSSFQGIKFIIRRGIQKKKKKEKGGIFTLLIFMKPIHIQLRNESRELE